MLNLFQKYREREWREISADDYQRYWEKWGGSVITHPVIIKRLSGLANLPVRYVAWPEQGEIQAVIPLWGRELALSKRVLKKRGLKGLYDLGNAEVILPVAPTAKLKLPFKLEDVSCVHESQFIGLKVHKSGIALARQASEYSKKFRYNQRRELRLLEEAGGRVASISTLSSEQQAAIYTQLFEQRWGFDVPGKGHLQQVFSALREFMTGSVVYLQEEPIAIQILYKVESPKWISVEYINGGVAPDQKDFSPGSVLSFVNTQAEWEAAERKNKPLRYSFGRDDREYKSRWCNSFPLYNT